MKEGCSVLFWGVCVGGGGEACSDGFGRIKNLRTVKVIFVSVSYYYWLLILNK